jgi:hypothetical protein
MLPLPHHVKLLDIRRIDVGERRVFGAGLIAAIVEPFDLPR